MEQPVENTPISLPDKSAVPADWVDPPAPEPRTCGGDDGECGKTILPVYYPAAFWEGHLLSGSGIWTYPELCPVCIAVAEKVLQELSKQLEYERVEQLVVKCGLAAKHLKMVMGNFIQPPSEPIQQAITAAMNGFDNLFIYGPPGNGKTHLAVGLLRSRIHATGVPGYFESMPELMAKLRKGAKKGADLDLIDRLSSAGTLVLDDIGVERPTAYVEEAIYLLVDRWYKDEKKGLILTCNHDLGWLSERLDDRIASRIAGMCRILEFTGEDWRIRRAPADSGSNA